MAKNSCADPKPHRNALLRFGKAVGNDLFMTLCRPFSSREVSVEPAVRSQQQDYYKYEQIGPSGMALLTENFLRGNLIHADSEKPKRILAVIDEFYRIARDPVYLLIAADLCRFFASKAAAEEQIKFHLSALRYCHLAFAAQKRQAAAAAKSFENFLFLQELQIFNQAIAGIFTYLKNQALLDSSSFTLHGCDGTEFTLEQPTFLLSVPRSAVTDFSLCSDYSVKALRLINRHSGMGVPLVARIGAAKLNESLRTPPGLTIPVTVFFRIKVRSERQLSLYPYYQDTSKFENFRIEEECAGQGDWILARDFTTPLACFLGTLTRRNLLSGMLHPVNYDQMSGLYMVEPYHPEKIPVVFVHGLMSSPETWVQMLNSLKYDSGIRQKYQFWFYAYSTGAPVLYSAGRLRKDLLAAQAEFCTTPEATASFNKMVLVGHSMGGLVARLLLQQNGDHMFQHFFHQDWEQVRHRLSPEDQQLVEGFLILKPLPFIRRAVFMAVPHRGAAMAKRRLARLGVKLIRMPLSLLAKADDLQRIGTTLLPELKLRWRKNSFITGLDNLDPDGVFVQWEADSPLKDGVVYHSIIGNQQTSGAPGGSDGVVPYFSSHLNGVASECIVRSGHSVHRNPEAIRELLRILLLHLKETTAPKN